MPLLFIGSHLFIHYHIVKRVIFKEVSGHWDLIKSEPGNRGLSACVTIHLKKTQKSFYLRQAEVHEKSNQAIMKLCHECGNTVLFSMQNKCKMTS